MLAYGLTVSGNVGALSGFGGWVCVWIGWALGVRIGSRRGGPLSVVAEGACRGAAQNHNTAGLANSTRKGYVCLPKVYIHLYFTDGLLGPILYLGCHSRCAYRSEALRKASAVS